jgi:hypothetical protein
LPSIRPHIPTAAETPDGVSAMAIVLMQPE